MENVLLVNVQQAAVERFVASSFEKQSASSSRSASFRAQAIEMLKGLGYKITKAHDEYIVEKP